ncbi:hypothetical protein GCM10023063_23100 [Arthrobacter methylotrophus]|uniref:hypothetical protein n=1 Tax=Arthrobacter methylotrophus TaxID=121291 RepID=UPI00336ECBED
MDLRGVLHHRRKVEPVQLGRWICSAGGANRVNYTRSDGQRDDSGILYRTGHMDSDPAVRVRRPRLGPVPPGPVPPSPVNRSSVNAGNRPSSR